MKNLLTILLLFISLVIFSKNGNTTTYYFSTSDGDDSRSSAQAQNSATPWKTLTKLNSIFSSLQPGDQVLFKRGDTFYGTITVSKSGTSASPIVFDAYGTGPAPIITGFTTVSSWTSVGNGLYQATVSGGPASLNMVTRDDAFQPMGKMPKGNKGYYSISAVGTNSVTSSGISGLPSFVGGEICWRAFHWVLWRGTVNSQSSTTVGFTPFASNSGGGTENPQVNYGFFFQNSPAACTQLGEWAYNGSTHIITMYFGTDNPSSHTIKVATVENLVTTSAGNSYLNFNNLSFQGGNTCIFNFVNSGNIKINSCNISMAGLYGIYGNGTAPNWSVTNSTISYCNSIAIYASSSSSAWTVSNNTILNTATVAGMGGTGENQYFGMKIRNGSVVTQNTIRNTGYIPLMFNGTNNLIQNNFIDSFGYVKDDAGGIYCGVDNLSGSKVVGNIVTRGIGCPSGTPDADMRAQGIYVDDGASSLEISGNTVAYCGISGIYVHNGHELNIHDNTLFDNGLASAYYYNDKNTIANVTYTNNINFAKTTSQLVYGSSGSTNSATTYFATLDNNYYCRPLNENSNFRTSSNSYNLAGWKTFIGKDANSKATPKTITDTSQLKFFYNNSASPKTFSFGATYIDVRNTSYAGSITLQPFTSAVLIYVSGTVANQPPVANAGPDQNFFLPTNSTTLNGSGADPDGTITAYQWTKISGPTQYTISTPTQAQTTINNLVQGVYQFELTVTDNGGATDKDTVAITVSPQPDQPPVANAGGSQVITLPTNTAILDGSASTDPDGTISAYSWTKISGPTAGTISGPSLVTTTANSLVQGVYQFELKVTDNQGVSSRDTITVTVNPNPNQSPIANAGLDISITLPVNSATLSGSGSDPDGTVSSYQWAKISGPSQYAIISPTQAQTTVASLVQGIYQFELTVTDNLGATGKDTVQVIVNGPPVNQPPVANAGGDINITLPVNTVTLNGSGSDPDGSVASYQWAKISGPSQYSIVSSSQAQTTVNNLVQGIYQFQLTVTDNQGAIDRDTMNVTVNPAADLPPVANAGPDITITLPTSSATLNGSGTDPDGTVASYQWTKIAGPTQYSLASSTSATATANGLAQGVYSFALTVTDNLGASASDTMRVTVNAAPNQPPVANAGPDIVITLPTNSVTLSGSGSDPDGSISSYRWSKLSGPSQYNFSSTSQAATSVNNLAQGVYVFALTVTDNQGAIASDTVQVTVNAGNQPPTANAGVDINITLPSNTVILNGSGTDPDGIIASYQWTKISGPSQYNIISPTQAQTSVSNLAQGTYAFELRVTDNLGATDRDTMFVNVNPAPNQAPTANAGPDISITLPTSSVTLSGSGSDPDGTIASYLWAKVSGPSQYTLVSSAQAQTSVNNLVQGTYRFALTVTDNQGATGRDTMTVTVNAAINVPPTANAGPDITITLPTNTASLNGSGTDPDGTISSYQWTKISGPTQFSLRSATRAKASLSSLVQGVYRFALKVTDNRGASASDTMTITVNAANQPPTASAGNDITITLPTNSVTLTGSGSDPDGTISSYQWTKIAGPGQYNIVASTQAQTVVNNLVQGTYQFQLKVTDNQGASGTDVVIVTVNPAPNQPPVANAGTDITITLPTNSTTLNGSGNDPDGSIAAYQWTKISGPSQFTIVSSAKAQTAVTNLVQGVYQFQLKVTDNLGATATDVVIVTVNPAPNQPPVANAGADITITLPTNNVTLNGSGTDPDGTIASYQWTKILGPTQYNIVSSGQAQTTVNNLAQGVYQFQLTVTDNQGATATDVVIVTVNAAANQTPSANAGADITITLPTNSVTLNGSGNDPDGTIVSYQWNKVSGPTQYNIVFPGLAQTTVNNLVEGVYQFELTVTDNQGATATDIVIVTVNPAPNQAPVANAGADITITLPTNSVTLNGSGNDPDGTIASYQWAKISGPAQFNIVSAGQAQTTVNNLVEGVYQFQLTVTDNQGATATDIVIVTVNPAPNQPPVANAGADITITLPTNSATLNGSGNDPDGSIASYQWTKISGPAQYSIVSATQSQTAINNLGEGVYQFQLTVTDNQGATATDIVIVTVNAAPNQSPVANAGADIAITLPTNSVTLNGSGNDPDGTIASYQWTKISGPAQFNIVSAAQAQTTINNLVEGVYQFQLTVTDNQGATATDIVIVTVNAAPNQPPVANAGTDITITLPTNNVTLNGSGNDPDGTIASYQWTKLSGPAQFNIVSAGQAQTSVDNLAEGVYTFQLTVTDNQGATATDNVVVTVNAATQPGNQAPTANAGPDITITLPTDSVTLNGSGSDADGTIASYQWTQISGPAQFTITNSSQAQTKVTGLAEGTYAFELKVTDNDGATGLDTITVTVNAAVVQQDLAPVANAGPDITTYMPNNTAIAAGTGSDPDGSSIASYQWVRISGPLVYTAESTNNAQLTLTDLVVGAYQFELRVTDSSGKVGRDTVNITVNPQPLSTAKVYPNPAKSTINVQMSSTTKTSPTSMRIYDSKGNIVYQESFMRADQVMTKQVNINNLSNGVYYIEMNIDINNIKTLMFVKQ